MNTLTLANSSLLVVGLVAVALSMPVPEPEEGTVVRVDLSTREVAVLLNGIEYRALESETELLGQDGKPIDIEEFLPHEDVVVTKLGDIIARIQKIAPTLGKKGTVVRVNLFSREIVVMVNGVLHTASELAVELFDRAGNVIRLEDFAPRDEVLISGTRGVICIQKLKPAGTRRDGSVARVDLDTREITVMVDEVQYTATESDVELLDDDGNLIDLESFVPVDQVRVTIVRDVMTCVQKLSDAAPTVEHPPTLR